MPTLMNPSLLTDENCIAASKPGGSGDFIEAHHVGDRAILCLVADIPGTPTAAGRSIVDQAWDEIVARVESSPEPTAGAAVIADALNHLSAAAQNAGQRMAGFVVLIRDGIAYIGGVGDCVAALLGHDHLQRYTYEDQNKYGYLGHSTYFPASVLKYDNTTRLGALPVPYSSEAVHGQQIEPFDYLLLWTDGLYDHYPELMETIRPGRSQEAIVADIDPHVPRKEQDVKDDISFGILSLAAFKVPVSQPLPSVQDPVHETPRSSVYPPSGTPLQDMPQRPTHSRRRIVSEEPARTIMRPSKTPVYRLDPGPAESQWKSHYVEEIDEDRLAQRGARNTKKLAWRRLGRTVGAWLIPALLVLIAVLLYFAIKELRIISDKLDHGSSTSSQQRANTNLADKPVE